MPHLEFSEEELEIRHPSLKAPAEEKLEDHLKDGDDGVYNQGLAIAEKIQEEVDELGRRRHATREEKVATRDEKPLGVMAGSVVRTRPCLRSRPPAGGVRRKIPSQSFILE